MAGPFQASCIYVSNNNPYSIRCNAAVIMNNKSISSNDLAGGDNGGWKYLSLEKAVTSLEEHEFPRLLNEDIVCILHKCRKERHAAAAQRLHAYMYKHSLDGDPLLGNHLVSALVKVGRIREAHQVFGRLVQKKDSSWNSLLAGYIKHGESQRAVDLYKSIPGTDVVELNQFTLVALLKICSLLKDFETGCKLHVYISTKGLAGSSFIGSTLISMYAKCGSLSKAQEVFGTLTVRNVVSWNALLAGYTDFGRGEDALMCFEQMKLEGISPNAVSFACSLKACGSIGAAERGREIHAEVARNGYLESNLFVSTAVVDMYARCGLLAKAQIVFDKLRVRDVVMWNALITGYIQQGYAREALNCFERMNLEGVSPDAVTFICGLKACGSIGDTGKGQALHSEIARSNVFRSDLVVNNALVDMYAKCGSLSNAQEVFDKLSVRDLVSWNALIGGYAQHSCGDEALKRYELMLSNGVCPDIVTFVCILKACGSIQATDKGIEIHAEIVRRGTLDMDPLVGNALVDMYCKCGSFAKAQEMFEKLIVRDVVSWTTLITGYVHHGLGKEALKLYDLMQLEGVSPNLITFVYVLKACGIVGATDKGQQIHAEIGNKGDLERDLAVCAALVDMYTNCGSLAKAEEVFEGLVHKNIVLWNSLISAFTQYGHGDKALNYFERMQVEGILPDVVTFVCSLKACASIGAMDKGKELHAEIIKKGWERDLQVGTSLVDMYTKCGLLINAKEVFKKLLVRDLQAWTALMNGHTQSGEAESVFHVFDEMLGEGMKPDLATFTCVLNACSHTGLVDKGLVYFEAMSKDHGMGPTLEHHTCMIDLLCRAGQLDKAVAMIKRIPFHVDIAMWHTMLGARQRLGLRT